jgi:hypothetical protein
MMEESFESPKMLAKVLLSFILIIISTFIFKNFWIFLASLIVIPAIVFSLPTKKLP